MSEPHRSPAGTIVARGLRLQCPRCGGSKLFVGWFRMHERCSSCDLKYERAPGYFLGSAYINYGATALLVTAFYVISRYVLGYENRQVLPLLLTFCVLFPLLFFRHARSLWLSLDTICDPEGSGESES